MSIIQADLSSTLVRLHQETFRAAITEADVASPVVGTNRKGDGQRAFDIAADLAVRRFLERDFISGIILSEESDTFSFGQVEPAYRFIVDPVDGSDNWARGLAYSSLSVAVLPAQGPIALDRVVGALVGNLTEGAPVVAIRGEGAHCGTDLLQASATRKLEDAFISCELNHFSPTPPLGNLFARARAVRSYGCASQAILLVARGSIDAHIDVRSRLTPESFLAAAAVLQEAGGCVLDAEGKPLGDFSRINEKATLIAAATKELAREIVDALAENRGGTYLDDPPAAVILAAGNGSRLTSEQNGAPKPVLNLLGMSLAERAITSCVAAGIRRFIIVLGYRADQVQAHYEKIAARRNCSVEFVTAQDWKLGNGVSALAAADKVGRAPFLLIMSDHLIAPSLVETVLGSDLRERGICLAVDRHKDGVFDLEDVTKVVLKDNLVTRVGKDLEEWDAADTGVFLCTDALFGAIKTVMVRGRYSLSDGVIELAADDRVSAVDVTGEVWIDVDTPEALQEARRRILASLTKGGADGFVSTWLNRPVSRRLSEKLAMTAITPNQITVISFLICLIGAGLLSASQYTAWLIGGLLVQLASIVDGCDGEIARLKHLSSPRGAWLDTILDRYGDVAVALAVTYAYAAVHPGPAPWIAGFLAAFGFILASYVTKEYAIRHGQPYPDDVLNRIKRRDLRLLLISVGAVAGHPFEALMLGGILSHISVIGILIKTWRKKPDGRRPRGEDSISPLVPIVSQTSTSPLGP